MDSYLSFSDFVDYFREHLSDGWQEGRKIEIRQVQKNNGMLLTGISLPKEGCLITPTFYLEAFYEIYLDDVGLPEILDDFRRRYEEAEESVADIDVENMISYPKVRDQIIFRIINYEKNQEMLEDCPHIRLHDLAVTFRCLMSWDQKSMSSSLISYEQMEDWGISMEELMIVAERNTSRLFPAKITPLKYFLKENEEDFDPEEAMIFIATNIHMIDGATVILYKGLLDSFADLVEGDFYILPSSVHELLFIPEFVVFDEIHLKEMVKSVNDTEVQTDEILSYSIYYYNKKEKKLTCRGSL